MTVLANSLLNLTRPQLLDRYSNNGNVGGSRHGTSSSYQSTVPNGHMYHNTYPHYNSYSGRGSGRGTVHSTTNHVTHQRQIIPPNRPRGASGSNGHISTSGSNQNRSRSVVSQSTTKYVGGPVIYRGFNGNTRGSYGNGPVYRGRGQFGNGIQPRGRGRSDGKT